MPLIFDHSRQPPGGHLFTDTTGYTIRADTLHGLIAAVSAYRVNNGLTEGNPAKEIEADYAVRFPWLITNVGSPPKTVIDPVTKWVNAVSREPQKVFAESETTRARMAICEACQYYAASHKFGIEDTRRLSITGKGRLKPMGACKAHHLACGLAVVMDAVSTPLKVEGCWIT